MAYGSATHPFASIHVRLWRNAIRALWPHGKHNKNAGGGEGIFRFHPARATYRGVMTDLHDSWHKTPQSGDADSGCIEGAPRLPKAPKTLKKDPETDPKLAYWLILVLNFPWPFFNSSHQAFQSSIHPNF